MEAHLERLLKKRICECRSGLRPIVVQSHLFVIYGMRMEALRPTDQYRHDMVMIIILNGAAGRNTDIQCEGVTVTETVSGEHNGLVSTVVRAAKMLEQQPFYLRSHMARLCTDFMPCSVSRRRISISWR